MDTLAKRTKYHREKNGWSQTELGDMIGVSQQAIQRIEAGDVEQPRKLKKMAEIFGISYDELLHGASTQPYDTSALGSSGALEENVRANQIKDLPVLGTRAVMDDSGFYTIEQGVSEFMARPPQLQSVPKAYAIYVYDDEMAPRYEAGDILYIHPGKPIKEGHYVCVKISKGGEEKIGVFQFIEKSHTHVCIQKISGNAAQIRLHTSNVRSIDPIILSHQQL